MKFLITFLLAGIISCCAFSSKGQTKAMADYSEATTYVNNFFDIYKSQGSNKALDYLATKHTGIVISAEQWNFLKSKLDSVRPVLGNFTGYEIINQKAIARSIVFFSYLVKHINHPIRFTFIFYKPEDHWVIHNVLFDSDEMFEELKQSGKIN